MQRGPTARLKILALLTAASIWAGQTQSPGRSAIRELRFSPDGRYILAQDASGITVLAVTPLAVLFRIPAEDATDVQFTRDSQSLVLLAGGTRVDPAEIKYSNSGARVERWSIADRAREMHDLPPHACAEQKLSPDGRVLVCDDVFDTLWLIDTNSGAVILRKDAFGTPEYGWKRASVMLAFSPDSRYVIAAMQERFVHAPVPDIDLAPKQWWNARAIAWDLQSANPLPLRDHLDVLVASAVIHRFRERRDRRRYVTFVAPDRLLVSDLLNATKGHVKAALLEFPSGRLLSNPVLPAGELLPAADPNFVVVRLTGRDEAAAVELNTGQRILTDTPALDVFGDHYVAETEAGSVGLYEHGKGLQATIDVHQR